MALHERAVQMVNEFLFDISTSYYTLIDRKTELKKTKKTFVPLADEEIQRAKQQFLTVYLKVVKQN